MNKNKSVRIVILLFLMESFWHGDVCAENPELENILNNARKVIIELLQAPDGRVPRDLINRSKAIIVFPSVIRAGMGIGGQYGKGVALRRDPSDRKWGPPAFVTLIGGSFGWQIGVQSSELTLLVMSDVDLRNLFKNRFTIGVDASVAAGPIGREASADTDISLSSGILSYSRVRGLFAGLTVQGAVLQADWDANEAYYGSDVSIIDIFFHKQGQLSPAAVKLAETLNSIASK
ncbi:MAG: lipid-binding SYLF domain-containing protein [Deltaproteobacteria bacterium]|nr:lipid-binding SYLF domain-containing protein [Deltaproteobacteria bacterium]